MSNTLNVRITTRSSPTGDVYEGTVNIADVRPTKLVRRADGTTLFPTRNVAKRLGYTDVAFTDPAQQSQTKATAKKAAKKSSTTTSTASNSTSSTAGSSEARRS